MSSSVRKIYPCAAALFANVRKLMLANFTELWRLDLFSCTSSSFLCAGTLSPRGKFSYFFAGGLVGVDKHLFQRVSLITSMSLPLNYIFVLLFTNVDVIPKQKQLSTV